MKQKLKKAALFFGATMLLIIGLLLGIILNPSLSYANKTVYGNYTTYHQQALYTDFMFRLHKTDISLRSSELCDANFHMDICLNDGSFYPILIEKLRGQVFG